MADPAKPPYKFLDSYGGGDAAIFFGRERETEILLADVVLSRLVVLFAKTGTGKTSLINAAVRPELEKRGFETFFVRVQDDPVASAREELRRHPRITRLPTGPLSSQLERVVTRLERPIVVFFDQFEEFFLYQTRDEVAAARGFIDDVAKLDRNRASGVHMVFSMREDFYVEMDIFRDAIPTIFQSDSSLRLRWFDERQARAAIVGPAETEKVKIEPRLVDRLVEDLSSPQGLVEPAQLQIVCHTLWGTLENGRITLDSYRALGAESERATIAEQILNRRIVRQFGALEEREELAVLERLLAPGVLSTERGTKRVRDVQELARELEDVLADGRDRLSAVLAKLENGHLVRRYMRDGRPHVEFTHDYLVTEPERLAELQRSVRNIWPRRILDRGASAWDEERRAFSGQTLELEEVLRRAALEWKREQDEGPHADHLSLSGDDARILLHLALHRGVYAREAFELASARGVPAWELVAEKLEGRHVDDAVNAVALLAELGSAQAVDHLGDALDREHIARDAVAALARIASVDAVDALGGALGEERLGRDVQEALETIARSATDAEARAGATTLLVRHFRGQLDDSSQAAFALEDLGRIEAEQAVAVLEGALARPELAADAESALRRVSRSSRREVAKRASEALSGRAQPGPADPAPPPPPRSAKRRGSPTALETHYRLVANAVVEGRVVVLLGDAANATPRPPGQTWKPGRDLPTAADIADYLAKSLPFPVQSRELPAVAQAFAAVLGEEQLHRELNKIFAHDFAPTPVHAFVASLPSLLRQLDLPPPLVLTTSYDSVLERTFSDRDEACAVLVYGASEGSVALKDTRSGQLWREDMTFPPDEPTILKLLGEAGSTRRPVVTEDDFALFLMGLQHKGALIGPRLDQSHILYLGYEIKAWGSRLALDVRSHESRMSYKSWAIARNVDELSAALWDNRGVESFERDPAAYVVELDRHVREAAAAASTRVVAETPGTLESYQQSAAEYGDDATRVSALIQLAQVHNDREEYREAIDVCSQAIALAPSDPVPYYERATSNWYAGSYAEAVDDFTRVLELEPNWWDAYSGRGQALAEWGQFERALKDLDRAIKHGSGAYARNGKGLALGGLKQFDKALKEFERSLREEPGNAWAYFNRALTYERMGESRNALKDFRRALEMSDPPLNAHKREAANARLK